jgi:hypothetical protein
MRQSKGGILFHAELTLEELIDDFLPSFLVDAAGNNHGMWPQPLVEGVVVGLLTFATQEELLDLIQR